VTFRSPAALLRLGASLAEEKNIVKILQTEMVTHNVKRFKVEKPKNYNFTPGQATDVSINSLELKDKKRPFTFTCLPSSPFLEFTIKMYPDHEKGVTKHLKDLKTGDSLIIRDVFGAIHYKGQGVFIAGGAGVTPFIAILRFLKEKNNLKGNTLIFSNKTSKDIILEKEFKEMEKLGLKLILTLTKENNKKYDNRRIDEYYLKEKIKDFSQHFYICGPIRMVGEITSTLGKLGANPDSLVVES